VVEGPCLSAEHESIPFARAARAQSKTALTRHFVTSDTGTPPFASWRPAVKLAAKLPRVNNEHEVDRNTSANRSSVRARSTATLNIESNDIGTPHRCMHATHWSTSLASGGTLATEGTTETTGGAVVALTPSFLAAVAAAAAAAAMEAASSAPGDGLTPA